MNEPLDISRWLVLRKITRAVGEVLSQELKTHLATLAPLLQPRHVLGQHLRANEKQSVKGDAEGPMEMRDGMNQFLRNVEITFRRDPDSGRPRINKKDSRLDREQKLKGEYYYG